MFAGYLAAIVLSLAATISTPTTPRPTASAVAATAMWLLSTRPALITILSSVASCTLTGVRFTAPSWRTSLIVTSALTGGRIKCANSHQKAKVSVLRRGREKKKQIKTPAVNTTRTPLKQCTSLIRPRTTEETTEEKKCTKLNNPKKIHRHHGLSRGRTLIPLKEEE